MEQYTSKSDHFVKTVNSLGLFSWKNNIDSISHETGRLVFKKNELKPWQRKGWVIPPEENCSFVAHIEMVLSIYKCILDPRYPVVCMDESPKQLIAETKVPISESPGQVARLRI